MKKIALILAMVMLFTIIASGCGTVRGVEIDYGISEIYTEEDIKDALPGIFINFIEFHADGSKLQTLTYAGDEACEKQLDEWKNSNKKRFKKYDQCMIFKGKAIVETTWNSYTYTEDYTLEKYYTLEECEFTYILGKEANNWNWRLENTYQE